MRFSRAVALGFDNWIAIAAPLTDGGEDAFGNTVEGLGLVELRRDSNGDWGTNWGDTQDEFRPENLSLPLNYDDSQFGTSLAFGGQRWLAVGAPRWSSLPFPGAPRGTVWLYAEPDRIFNDRFEQAATAATTTSSVGRHCPSDARFLHLSHPSIPPNRL